MKKIFLIVAMFSFTLAHAQYTTGNSNKTAGDKNISVGYFEINALKAGVMNHYDVNYILSPKSADNKLELTLSTAFPMILSGKIVDAMGKTIDTWTPGNIGYRYHTSFDVSNYADGNYNFVVFDNNGTKVSSIPFEKVAK